MILRDYMLHNFWWKLLSLLLASLTWLTIDIAFHKDLARKESPVVTSSTRTFATVPITMLAPTANTNRYKLNPVTASVEVSGKATELLTLQLQEIKAFVDVTDAGDQKGFRRPLQIQLPGELKVSNMSPTNVSVERVTTAKQPTF